MVGQGFEFALEGDNCGGACVLVGCVNCVWEDDMCSNSSAVVVTAVACF